MKGGEKGRVRCVFAARDADVEAEAVAVAKADAPPRRRIGTPKVLITGYLLCRTAQQLAVFTLGGSGCGSSIRHHSPKIGHASRDSWWCFIFMGASHEGKVVVAVSSPGFGEETT